MTENIPKKNYLHAMFLRKIAIEITKRSNQDEKTTVRSVDRSKILLDGNKERFRTWYILRRGLVKEMFYILGQSRDGVY